MSLTKVELEQQVVDFIRSLAPEPRQAIRRSLKKLENEEGDIRSRLAVRRSGFGIPNSEFCLLNSNSRVRDPTGNAPQRHFRVRARP